jgi:ATP-dependent protease ClpP protease subunit
MAVPAQPQEPKPLYIWFSCMVDQTSVDTLMNAIVISYNQGVRDVHLLLSTSGGGIMQGMTLFNFLCGIPINLTTHNVGNVDSVGNVIFLAGKRRFACAHSTFMFHGVAFNTAAASSFGEQQLSEMMVTVKSDQRRIANLVSERTKLPEQDVVSMFGRAATKSAEEALAGGIVHEIKDVEIPANAIVASLTAPTPQNAGR